MYRGGELIAVNPDGGDVLNLVCFRHAIRRI